MNNPAEIVIAFFELLEAELREVKQSIEDSAQFKASSLKRAVMRLAAGVALILAAIVLVLAAVGMMIWSLYLYIGQFTNPASAALITGVVTLVAASILTGIARWLNR